MSGHSCAELGCGDPPGSACHCPACHQTFGDVALFDAHRPRGGACLAAPTMRVSLSGQLTRQGGYPLDQDALGTWHGPAAVRGRRR